VLFRGGRRGAAEPVAGAEEEALGFEFEAAETEVLGVVAPISPGDGVFRSAMSADGDSEDIMLSVSRAGFGG
jgi:hypothetical protein